MKDTFFSFNKHLVLKGNLINFPCVMGIININSDSFYSKSRAAKEEEWLMMAEKHLNEGATLLDIGATSTRPGAALSSAEEECNIIMEVLHSLHKAFPDALISVDTYHKKTAEQAMEHGACLINDISGGRLDNTMIPYILDNHIPYVAMHSRGTPATMKELISYENVAVEIYQWLQQLENQFLQKGHTNLVLDPGIGFAKTIHQNFELLQKLSYFQNLQSPILIGLSRKSLIYNTLNSTPEQAGNGTSVLNTVALMKGADILRVHDVKEAQEAVTLLKRLHHVN